MKLSAKLTNKTIVTGLLLAVAFFVLLNTPVLHAADGLQSAKDGLGVAARLGGFSTDGEPATPAFLVAKIIKIILGFIGTIFLVLIIFSGFQWMTAGGNEETIKASRKRIVNSTIGMAIVLGAWVITNFVMSSITSL